MAFWQQHRVATAVMAVVLLARCGGSSCGCIQPLTAPFPDNRKVNQVVQARVTPDGFTFVNQKLPTIIGTLVPTDCDGSTGVNCPGTETCGCPQGATCDPLCPASDRFCVRANPRECLGGTPSRPTIGFRVPPISQNFSDGDPKVRVCTTDRDLSWNNCSVYVTLNGTTLTPINETDLRLNVNLDVKTPARPNGIKIYYDTGQAFYEPSATCTLYPDITSRDATGIIRLGRDAKTDRTTITLVSLDVPFSGDDVTIKAESGEDTVTCFIAGVGFVKDIIINQVKDQLTGTLRDAIDGALKPVTTQSCDHHLSTYQCPLLSNGEQTACLSDDLCHFSTGTQAPIPALLGMEGKVDLGGTLPAFIRTEGDVLFSAFAGGTRMGGGPSAYLAGNGLNLGMVGGASATKHPCVPNRTRDTSPVPQYAFPSTIGPAGGGAAAPYMVGLVVHDRLLEEVIGEAYSGGLLCQDISTDQVGLINSGIIGLLLGESDALTALMGESSPPRPVVMELRPRDVPEIQIGLGTQGPDPMDATRVLLDEPLLTLSIPNLDIDIYTLVDDRFIRLVTLSVDLAIGLGLELNAQNQVHLIANPVDTWVLAVRARNSDILHQSADEIAMAVPELLAAFLPQFAPNLDQTFDLPSLQGFGISGVRFRGVQPQAGQMTVLGHPRQDFLGLFSNLSFAAPGSSPSTLRVETRASLTRLELPAPDELHTMRGAARKRIKAFIKLDSTAPDSPVEHSYRIDGGFWHPYIQTNELVVSDAELNLQGWHTVEIRARAVGAPGTLDETPEVITLLSDVEAPILSASRMGQTLRATVSDRVALAGDIQVRARVMGGDWVEMMGLGERALELGSEVPADARLDVEAVDQAGHTTRVSLGTRAAPEQAKVAAPSVPVAVATEQLSTEKGWFNCASSSDAPGSLILVMLVLLGIRRRR